MGDRFYQRLWRAQHRDKVETYHRTQRFRWHARPLEEKQRIQRDQDLRKLYNLTIDEYDEMVRKQNNQCAICFTEPTDCLQVDHDHTTNVVRGLLCSACNRILGLAKDSEHRLQSAISYLRTHNACTA